ncbi:hypothetical protein JAAARDRAFT_688159 [Jaapia argillacea MUCL 33604]|uniref:6-phosphogluconate dehydrogenase, decarboxylating n=1 Tax=Jaapia argillacea MUCL 33604 TaxID=933084 RepID=A0A067PQE4_9AGAM|nr:hypothetical protein JAAARDRAFT_688159 [Jaapia argillacea MUCL 33604]
MSSSQPFQKIGVVGAGSMGSEMAMLFAENGLTVSSFDVAHSNIDNLLEMIKTKVNSDEVRSRISGYKDYDSFIKSLGGVKARKLFVFSVKHGEPSDQVLEAMTEYLHEGDVILDGGNEWYRNTERRQKALAPKGVYYIGMGVSGGYQSARRGPSMSPGGDKTILKEILPLLERFAAKDQKTGSPCVTIIGPRGSGHYVKMVHNGIEQGMLGILSEAWEFLYKCLHIPLDDISNIFREWSDHGELKRNFLVEIGADICAQPDPSGSASHLLNKIQDKVVQDADSTEGTGYWCIMESAERHVSAPTIAAAHFFRVASANRASRLKVVEALGQDMGAARKQSQLTDTEKKEHVEDLRQAVYAAFLASFVQGLNLIARASRDEGWGVDLGRCIKIWREGCIIRSEYVADLLQPLLEKREVMNVLALEDVAKEVKRTIPALSRVVQRGLEFNTHIPTLSASLEYYKYCAGLHLPTQFMEAQLDYFGAHSFDLKEEGAGEVKKGKHHFEWKPA